MNSTSKKSRKSRGKITRNLQASQKLKLPPKKLEEKDFKMIDKE